MRAFLLACATTSIAVLLGLATAPPALAQPSELVQPSELAQPGEAARAPTPHEVAQEEQRSHWRPEWRRFDVANAMIIVVAESAAFAVYFAQPVTEALWTSTLPLDEELRDVFRVSDQGTKDVLVTASDALFLAMLAWPIAVDSVLLAGAVRGDWDVALQTALIDLQVLAVAQMATWLTSRLTGRVRPESVECVAAGTCLDEGSGPVQSFVGGHSLMAFASAGLTCTHHLESPWIAGNVEAAAMTCGSSLVLATALGFMRLAVDRHWASDIALGSAMGAAIGFAMPYLLHYRAPGHRAPGERAGRGHGLPFAITPGHAGDPRGVGIVGMF